MILPAKKQLLLLSALLGFSVIASVGQYYYAFINILFWWVFSFGAIIIVWDGLKAWRLSRQLTFSGQREMPHNFAVGRFVNISLTLFNTTPNSFQMAVFDHIPESFDCTGMPTYSEIKAGENPIISYAIKPNKRGTFLLEKIQLRLSSPLNLWHINQFISVRDEIKVYPDFSLTDSNQLTSDSENIMGNITKQRKRGLGTDFAQLREYREGDSLKQIDYKATARMNKLISKEYQIERDQQVMILLDCSRRMRVYQDGLSHFDYALNSAVYLARTILNQGDAVGIMSFGTDVIRFAPPKKGRNSVNNLLNQVFDLHTSRQSPDYVKAAEDFMARQKRRSLVILVTNLQEEDTVAVQTMLRILQKKHVVLIANLKEELLGQPVTIEKLEDAVFYASREVYHRERQAMMNVIKNKKLILLDTYPTKLSSNMINYYLNIKQSGIF